MLAAPGKALLTRGETFWRLAPTRRAAFLIASGDYFRAALEAMRRAQRSIHLLGWTFDPRTRLAPDGRSDLPAADEVGRVLLELSQARPTLDIRLLIWKSALPIAATQQFFPHAARRWFSGSRVEFRLDDQIPLGACHHQKVLVIDDQLAFCGGGDISVDRWDSWLHLQEDRRRILPNRTVHAPRHELMMMVEGPVAQVLGEHFRARWRLAGGPACPAPAPDALADLWPAEISPDLTDAELAIARTAPGWRGEAPVGEIRKLTLASIAQARQTIYLENQYFTSPEVAAALAARLGEPEGPEVVLITTRRAPSWFDRLTMDRARAGSIARLRAADRFGRFHAFSPVTTGGRDIVVHSKASVFDDRIVRVGSANLNNRSLGFDSECELAVECDDGPDRRAVRAFRDRLVGHFLGLPADRVAEALAHGGGLGRAIAALNDSGRLAPLAGDPARGLGRLVAAYHLGDPMGASDAWRPWRRRGLF